MTWPPGAHASTFGGNPVSCAAANATIKLLKESLVANAAAVGAHLMDGLRALQDKHPLIGDVRGKGLMIGVELVRDRQTKERAVEERNALVQAMFRRGVLVLGAGRNALRLAPPLVLHEGPGRQRAAASWTRRSPKSVTVRSLVRSRRVLESASRVARRRLAEAASRSADRRRAASTCIVQEASHDDAAADAGKAWGRSRGRGTGAARVRNSCAPLPHAAWRNRHRGARRRDGRVRRGQGEGDGGIRDGGRSGNRPRSSAGSSRWRSTIWRAIA